MRGLLALLTFATSGLLVAADGAGGVSRLQKTRKRRGEQPRDHQYYERAERAPTLSKRSSRFLNSKSEKFAVNGSALPEIDWDVGESYAGNLPISNHPDESRELYFWFFPSTNPDAGDEITIWLQGGPGAASTGGLLFLNGPILLQPGTVKPTRNAFSWNNLTNVVWIDQPVGTGFSVGTPNVTNEYEVAKQFTGFFRNFVDTFNIHGFDMYLTGESYAGYYVPYIANDFLDANDTDYFNLKGVALNDPIIGNLIVQTQVIAMQYLNTWSPAFAVDPVTMANFSATSEKCGYDNYMEKYFQFPPPPAPFPGPFGNDDYGSSYPEGCVIQDAIVEAAVALNPCFNYEHIFDTCPVLYSGLGIGLSDYSPAGPASQTYSPAGPKIYFDREDVREAIHAPPGVTWSLSASKPVFLPENGSFPNPFNDISLPPADIGILTKIVEATNNLIIGVGGLDFQLPANGTLLVLQNMTWNGGQGFATYPDQTLYVPQHPTIGANSFSGHGEMGTWTEERGLTFYVSHLAGHELAWYTPGVAYRVIQQMLGQILDLSDTSKF